LIPFRTILILSKLRKNKEKIMGKVSTKKRDYNVMEIKVD
jgi:hypothetical protein